MYDTRGKDTHEASILYTHEIRRAVLAPVNAELVDSHSLRCAEGDKREEKGELHCFEYT